MEAPLQEAFNQSKFSATLTLHLIQAYDKFVAALTFAHNGGIFVADENFVMWVETVKNEINSLNYNEEEKDQIKHVVFLDKNKKPVRIDDVNEFSKTIFSLNAKALRSYYAEYTALVKERSVKKIVNV